MGCVEVAFKVDPSFENVKWAIRQVFKRVKMSARRNEYPMNVVMNVRFINNSNCWLSPAFGEGHTCYIEILSRTKKADWQRFSGQVAQDWLTLPARNATLGKRVSAYPECHSIYQKQFWRKHSAL